MPSSRRPIENMSQPQLIQVAVWACSAVVAGFVGGDTRGAGAALALALPLASCGAQRDVNGKSCREACVEHARSRTTRQRPLPVHERRQASCGAGVAWRRSWTACRRRRCECPRSRPLCRCAAPTVAQPFLRIIARTPRAMVRGCTATAPRVLVSRVLAHSSLVLPPVSRRNEVWKLVSGRNSPWVAAGSAPPPGSAGQTPRPSAASLPSCVGTWFGSVLVLGLARDGDVSRRSAHCWWSRGCAFYGEYRLWMVGAPQSPSICPMRRARSTARPSPGSMARSRTRGRRSRSRSRLGGWALGSVAQTAAGKPGRVDGNGRSQRRDSGSVPSRRPAASYDAGCRAWNLRYRHGYQQDAAPYVQTRALSVPHAHEIHPPSARRDLTEVSLLFPALKFVGLGGQRRLRPTGPSTRGPSYSTPLLSNAQPPAVEGDVAAVLARSDRAPRRDGPRTELAWGAARSVPVRPLAAAWQQRALQHLSRGRARSPPSRAPPPPASPRSPCSNRGTRCRSAVGAVGGVGGRVVGGRVGRGAVAVTR